jgi:hypothetical protein
MAEQEYRRLTWGKRRALFALVSTSQSSLWLGKDHVLQIDTSGYTESYKRFYFRDIQALVVCRTNKWWNIAIAFAALASLFGLIAVFGGNVVLAWVFGIIAGIFAIFLSVDLAAGPTAKCYLRTAVQTEPLISITRLRRARKTFELLRPLITNSQAQSTSAGGPSKVEEEKLPPIIADVPRPFIQSQADPQSPPTQNQV